MWLWEEARSRNLIQDMHLWDGNEKGCGRGPGDPRSSAKKQEFFPGQTPSTSGVLAEKSDGICSALRGRVATAYGARFELGLTGQDHGRRRSLQAASSPFTHEHVNFPSHVFYISAVPEILGRSVGLFLGPGAFHQCSSHPPVATVLSSCPPASAEVILRFTAACCSL